MIATGVNYFELITQMLLCSMQQNQVLLLIAVQMLHVYRLV